MNVLQIEDVLSRIIPDEAVYYVEDMDCFAAVFSRGGQDDMEYFFVIHVDGDWQEHDACSCRLHLLEDMKRINHLLEIEKERNELLALMRESDWETDGYE
jgi:hypothetical protein